MMTVKQVSNISGVSIRTLQYYDKIGLFNASDYTQSGYRLYDDASLERLQQILLFRELGFELKEIKAITGSADFDREAALRQQIELLTIQKERLNGIIKLAQGLLNKEKNNMSFKVFSKEKQEKYASEAKKRWGETKAYKEYEEKNINRSSTDNDGVIQGLMEYFVRFGKMVGTDPCGNDAQMLAGELQDYITKNYYTCTDEIFASLGIMYSAGGEMTDNINKAGGEGTAQFSSDAIAFFCSNRK